MSAKHRCKECGHRSGSRRINIQKDADKKTTGIPAKKHCSHECHDLIKKGE